MEIGILVFDGKHAAEDALNEVFDAMADRQPWLHEVGVISRPVIGRLTIRASYPENKDVLYREGDIGKRAGDTSAYTGYVLGSLAGPFRASLLALSAGEVVQERVAEKEKKLFRIDELKALLPRASSALVLIAEPAVIDQMVEAFATYDAIKTVRRDVAKEMQRRLEALRKQEFEKLEQELGGEPAPAMH
jgi:hypothetical protein